MHFISQDQFKDNFIHSFLFLFFTPYHYRQIWKECNDLSADEAKVQFINNLNGICESFRPFVEAHQRERQERLERIRVQEEERRRQLEEEQRRTRLEEERLQLEQEEEERRKEQQK